MLTIGFDLDETLCDLQSQVNKLFNKYNLQPVSPIDWEFSNYSSELKKDVFKLFLDKDIMCSLKPFEKSIELINWLKNKDYKVVVVTARDKSLEIDTIQFVQKLFDVDCYVTGVNESKISLLKKLNVDIWVDDSPKIIEYQEAGLYCIMISNQSTLYNHYLRDDVFYVNCMEQLYKIIERLSKGFEV
jgi:phosphoglycolate phosphatase-like HAD superfamily hydrolase